MLFEVLRTKFPVKVCVCLRSKYDNIDKLKGGIPEQKNTCIYFKENEPLL